MIRPAVLAGLRRWREVAAAAGFALLGLWLMSVGGWILVPLGAALTALALGLGLLALRRLRFGQAVDAPGVVEVDEGQVGYFGPSAGGYVSLPELQELRLLTLRGRRYWRLKQADGQVLLIPVAASGAERLFDAFATLPGMDTQALVAALAPAAGRAAAGRGLIRADDSSVIGPVIWRRPARVALT